MIVTSIHVPCLLKDAVKNYVCQNPCTWHPRPISNVAKQEKKHTKVVKNSSICFPIFVYSYNKFLKTLLDMAEKNQNQRRPCLQKRLCSLFYLVYQDFVVLFPV